MNDVSRGCGALGRRARAIMMCRADGTTRHAGAAGTHRGAERGPRRLRRTPSARDVVACQCGDRRMWGLAVQLYALRSARELGSRRFRRSRRSHRDSRLRSDAAADRAQSAARAVSRPAGGREPVLAQQPPVSQSALYRSSMLSTNFRALLRSVWKRKSCELRAADMVQYAGVARAKLAALRACYARFRDAPDARRRDFEEFPERAGRGPGAVCRVRSLAPAVRRQPLVELAGAVGGGPPRRRSRSSAPGRPMRSAFTCTSSGSPKPIAGMPAVGAPPRHAGRALHRSRGRRRSGRRRRLGRAG